MAGSSGPEQNYLDCMQCLSITSNSIWVGPSVIHPPSHAGFPAIDTSQEKFNSRPVVPTHFQKKPFGEIVEGLISFICWRFPQIEPGSNNRRFGQVIYRPPSQPLAAIEPSAVQTNDDRDLPVQNWRFVLDNVLQALTGTLESADAPEVSRGGPSDH